MAYSRTPKYVQIATDIEHEIFKQQLQSGAPLPTEQELCERFGCSRGTVRQAIDILEKGGLVECKQGSGMSVGQRRVPASDHFVATIISNVTTAEHSRMVQMIGTAAVSLGYHPLFGVTNDEREIERQFIERIGRLRVVGVLKFPTNIEIESETRAHLREAGLPYVIVNDFWTDSREDVQVAYDERASVSMCVDHLVGLGHRRIVLIDSVIEPRHRAIDEFFKRLAHHGLPRGDKHLLLYDLVDPALPVDKLFESGGPKPTAFITIFDVIASQLLVRLSRLGIKVPADVSVANVNDIPLDMPMGLDLTTAFPPRKKMVDEALRALLAGRGESHVQHYIFKPEFHVGQTSGPSPEKGQKTGPSLDTAAQPKILESV